MRRAGMAGVGTSTLLVAVAYALAFVPGQGGRLAPTLLAVGTAGLLASTMALGAQRHGRLGVLWLPVVFVVLVVGGGLTTLLLLPATDPATPDLVLGLPPRAAFLLYGVGLVPTLVVPVAYALTFERLTLSEADVERVRAAARARVRGEGAPAPGAER